MSRKALFICLQGKNRSRTAADIFKKWTLCETKSAGSHEDAPFPLTVDDISWATIIFTMEKNQAKKIKKRFGEIAKNKRFICLDIPDEFDYGDTRLIRILEGRAGPYLSFG